MPSAEIMNETMASMRGRSITGTFILDSYNMIYHHQSWDTLLLLIIL